MADRRSALERPSCLVLHGLGGGPYELEPLIARLRAEGLNVLSPVLPGHDGPGPVMPASRWADWAATAEAAFDELSAAGGPVAVVGFSTGGTLALRLAVRRPVARLALLAPFLAIRYSGWIPVRPAAYLRHVARLIPNLPRRSPALRDRALRRTVAAASQFNTFSLAATLSALELIDEVKQDIPDVRAPTLILQGRLDTVVDPTRATWLHQTLGTLPADKRLVFMERSDHLLVLDRERDHVIAETLAFLDNG